MNESQTPILNNVINASNKFVTDLKLIEQYDDLSEKIEKIMLSTANEENFKVMEDLKERKIDISRELDKRGYEMLVGDATRLSEAELDFLINSFPLENNPIKSEFMFPVPIYNYKAANDNKKLDTTE